MQLVMLAVMVGWLPLPFPCRYAGILSAYGMALADVVAEHQKPFAAPYSLGMIC